MTFQLFMKSGAIEASWSTAAHVEKWSYLPEEGEVTVIDNEPTILNYHIEDIQGNIIQKSEIDIGEEISLVIETKNAIGETLQLDLDSNRLDFECNGLVFEDDIVEIQIVKEIERIHLKAVRQEK